MKLKRILALTMAFAMLIACTACSGKTETAAEVIEKMNTALETANPSKYDVSVDMDATVSLGDYGSMTMKIANNSAIVLSDDPYATHANINTEISYGEDTEPSTTAIETYTVYENDELVAYTSVDGGSSWIRSTSGLTEEEDSGISDIVVADAETSVIDTAVTEYNGEKAVCLTSTITGEELQSVIEAAGEEYSAILEGLDLTPLSCDVRLYVNSKTYLPIAEELNISGAGEVLTTLIASILGDGMTVEVPSCVIAISFASYDAQEAITVPQEVLDSAVEEATAIDDAALVEDEISEELETAESEQEAVKDEAAAQ